MAKRVESFEGIVGHSNLISFLKKHVENDDIANVIILHGNPGLGKTSIARLLAVEIACRYADDKTRQMYMKAVVSEGKDTDSVKMFNMSTGDKEKEKDNIQRVKSELNLSFSNLKRKVLILDEAHNMSNETQDAILADIDPPPEGIYIIICTTEIGSLREALQSRGKATFRLKDLTDVEAKKLFMLKVQQRGLHFDMSVPVVASLVCVWANNQPRRICNLLENFAPGSLVSTRELEVFINVTAASSVIELVKYLYGSLTLGMDYLNSMRFDDSFVLMLIEVTKVALGHTSSNISNKEVVYIKEFMVDKDVMKLVQFTAEVAGLSTLQKRRVISAFMRAHVSYQSGVTPKEMNPVVSRARDMETLAENVELTNAFSSDANIRVPSIEEMFSNASVVDESVVDRSAVIEQPNDKVTINSQSEDDFVMPEIDEKFFY